MGSMRAAFEQWYSDNSAWPSAIERNGAGYRLMQAQAAWTAWQAAWKVAKSFTHSDDEGEE